jgi:hypothetical protein
VWLVNDLKQLIGHMKKAIATKGVIIESNFFDCGVDEEHNKLDHQLYRLGDGCVPDLLTNHMSHLLRAANSVKFAKSLLADLKEDEIFEATDYSSKIKAMKHHSKTAEQGTKLACEIGVYSFRYPTELSFGEYPHILNIYGPFDPTKVGEMISISIRGISNNSNLSSMHAISNMEGMHQLVKYYAPWVRVIKCRSTDQVNYYSGSEALIGAIDYNNYQLQLPEKDRLFISMRAGPEPGHGKASSDTETNVVKSQNANACNAGEDIVSAADLITVCAREHLPGRAFFENIISEEDSKLPSPKTVTGISELRNWSFHANKDGSLSLTLHENPGIGLGCNVSPANITSLRDARPRFPTRSTFIFNQAHLVVPGVMTRTTVKQRASKSADVTK